MTDITGGDMEIMGRLMSAERLAVKRAHAARHPEGRTAELVAHIEAQAETIRELREAVTEAHDFILWLDETALVEMGKLDDAQQWLEKYAKLAAQTVDKRDE